MKKQLYSPMPPTSTVSSDRQRGGGLVMRTALCRRLTVVCLMAFGLLIQAACSGNQEIRGFVRDESSIEQIKTGLQSKDEVAELLGSPSSVATFTERGETWYYISQISEHLAFFNPTVTDQRVLAVNFDSDGMVAAIQNYKLADRKLIKPVSRTTPTRGRELGFFEQLFGNIGRFNGQAQPRGAPGRRP